MGIGQKETLAFQQGFKPKQINTKTTLYIFFNETKVETWRPK